ncbi:MAG: type II toxin-antitoxin system HipA family toxin, partial [Pseudomonadales bacterium]
TGWQRSNMHSALTLLGLNEMEARYASYEDLAELVRRKFTEPKRTLREVFARLAFNILCGNTDDHARNHAAFWDGKAYTLTPAYDICPQNRTGGEASQAMLIAGGNRSSRVATCLDAHHHFQLDRGEAAQLIEAQIDTIQTHWQAVCAEAQLTEADRTFFWHRQFLNPFALE